MSLFKLVCGSSIICGTGIRLIVDDRILHHIAVLFDHIVRVHADRYPVAAFLKDIRPVAGIIIGRHILFLKREGNGLALSRLQQIRLIEFNQVRRCLFHAAVGIRRIHINLNHFFSGYISCIRNSYIKCDVPVSVCLRLCHGLTESRITQPVTERINHCFIIVKIHVPCLCFRICSFIISVPHIDSFHIVYKRGDCSHFLLCNPVSRNIGVFLHIVIDKISEIIYDRCLRQISQESVHRSSRRVHFTAHNLSKGAETTLPRTGSPYRASDLLVIIQPSKLHGIIGIDNNCNVVKL